MAFGAVRRIGYLVTRRMPATVILAAQQNIVVGGQRIPLFNDVVCFQVERGQVCGFRQVGLVMVVDLDAVNAWANGEGTWSYGGAVARVDGPQELWVATDDPGGVTRVVTAQMGDEPAD